MRIVFVIAICMLVALAAHAQPTVIDANIADGKQAMATGNFPEAELRFLTALAEAEKADAQGRQACEIRIMLAQCYIYMGQPERADPLYAPSMERLETLLGAKSPQVRSGYSIMARCYRNAGDFARAEPAYRKWLDVTEKANGRWGDEIIEITCELARMLHMQGRDADAEPLLRQAVEADQKHREPGSKQLMAPWAHLRLTECLAAQGKYKEAEEALAPCLLDRAVGQYNRPDVLTTQGLLYFAQGCDLLREQALVLHAGLSLRMAEMPIVSQHNTTPFDMYDPQARYRAQGLFAKAEPLLRQALEMREKEPEPENVWRRDLHRQWLAEARNNLAAAYIAQGRPAQARPLLESARRLLEEVLKNWKAPQGGSSPGSEPPDLVPILTNQAASMTNGMVTEQGMKVYDARSRRVQDTEPLLKQALALREKENGRESLPVMRALGQLAMLYTWEGSYKVEAPLTRAYAIAEKQLSLDHPDMPALVDMLGWMYRDYYDKREEEIKVFQHYLERLKVRFGEKDIRTVSGYARLGWYHRIFGPPEQAEAMLKQALGIVQAKYGAESATAADALVNLAWGTYDSKKPDLFKQRMEQALAIRRKLFGAESLPVADMRLGLLYIVSSPDRKTEKAEAERILALYAKLCGPDSPEVMAVLDVIEDRYGFYSNLNERADLLRRRMTVAEKAFGGESPLLIPIAGRLGRYYNYIDKPEDGTTYFQLALTLHEKALGPDDAGVLPLLMALQENCYLTMRDTERRQLLQRALVMAEKIYGPESREVDPVLDAMVEASQTDGTPAETETWLRRRIGLWKAQEDGQGMNTFLVEQLAGNLQQQKKYPEAIALYKQVLAAAERDKNENGSRLYWPNAALAKCYEEWGKYAEAQPYRERALEAFRPEIEKSKAADVNSVIDDLGQNYRKQRKFAEAEKHYNEQLIRLKNLAPDKENYQLSALLRLAELAMDQQHYVQAKELYERMVRIVEKDFPAQKSYPALYIAGIADVEAAQKNYPVAEAQYKRAIQLEETVNYAKTDEILARLLERYAAFLRQLKRTDDAAKLETRAKTIRETIAKNQANTQTTRRRFREGSRMF